MAYFSTDTYFPRTAERLLDDISAVQDHLRRIKDQIKTLRAISTDLNKRVVRAIEDELFDDHYEVLHQNFLQLEEHQEIVKGNVEELELDIKNINELLTTILLVHTAVQQAFTNYALGLQRF